MEDLIFEEAHTKFVVEKADNDKDVMISIRDKYTDQEACYYLRPEQVKEIVNFLNKQL